MNNIRLNTGTLYCMIATLLITNTLAGQTYKRAYIRTSTAAARCRDNEFACDSSYTVCILQSKVCDAFNDCENGYDENFYMCQIRVCKWNEHKCANGQCISTLSGYIDIRSAEVQSFSSTDYLKNVVCDGRIDCNDRSDEAFSLCSNKFSKDSQHNATDVSIGPQEIDNAYPAPNPPPGSNDYDSGNSTVVTPQINTDVLCYCKHNTKPLSFSTSTTKRVSPTTTRKSVFHTADTVTTPPTPGKNSYFPTTIATTNTQRIVKCIIPANEGSRYYSQDEGGGLPLLVGTEVDKNTIINVTCEEGYHNVAQLKDMICDKTGRWNPAITQKLCLKKCPPMKSTSLNITCTFNNENVDCSTPAKPGTRLKPKCNYLYSLPNAMKEPEIELRCLSNGKWDGLLYECLPTCGRSLQHNSITNSSATTLEVPWNVAIYMQSINNTSELLCGGTLIASNLVVSAARCFWGSASTNYTILSNGQHKVIFGNKREFVLKNSHTQFIDVSTIFIELDYMGQNGNYVNDIAVLVLSKKVSNIDHGVSLVCIDWSSRYNVENGINGTIAGWRSNSQTQYVPNTDFLNVTLPYADRVMCRKIYENTNQFTRYISRDKFCAGSLPGPATYEIDSGAGLTFYHDGLHYLTGVKSIQDVNTNGSLSTFSDIGTHIEFVRDIYKRYTR